MSIPHHQRRQVLLQRYAKTHFEFRSGKLEFSRKSSDSCSQIGVFCGEKYKQSINPGSEVATELPVVMVKYNIGENALKFETDHNFVDTITNPCCLEVQPEITRSLSSILSGDGNDKSRTMFSVFRKFAKKVALREDLGLLLNSFLGMFVEHELLRARSGSGNEELSPNASDECCSLSLHECLSSCMFASDDEVKAFFQRPENAPLSEHMIDGWRILQCCFDSNESGHELLEGLRRILISRSDRDNAGDLTGSVALNFENVDEKKHWFALQRLNRTKKREKRKVNSTDTNQNNVEVNKKQQLHRKRNRIKSRKTSASRFLMHVPSKTIIRRPDVFLYSRAKRFVASFDESFFRKLFVTFEFSNVEIPAQNFGSTTATGADSDIVFPYGNGLYTIIALMNHSCDPNCEIEFVDENQNPAVKLEASTSSENRSGTGAATISSTPNPLRMMVRALKQINPGEELTVDYIDGVSGQNNRAARLFERYGIEKCWCLKCKKGREN